MRLPHAKPFPNQVFPPFFPEVCVISEYDIVTFNTLFLNSTYIETRKRQWRAPVTGYLKQWTRAYSGLSLGTRFLTERANRLDPVWVRIPRSQPEALQIHRFL